MQKSEINFDSGMCDIEVVNAVAVDRAREQVKSEQAVALLAETFRVLGDSTRLRIILALKEVELCVCDLASVVNVSSSTVSHSLRVLRQMNLVRFRKEGKIAYYRLDDEHIAHLLDEGFTHVEELI
ncbi:MAG TPA: metalloregulator ArsR/SmtB family transcription factor [Pyrinomonadaceae bacterium]|nr:metalloregulator ArsR/SmtB family transcription factor [Pyrinomonadaceae bacterium]